MNRPCTCDRCTPEPWAAYTLDQCRLCWLYHHDLDYRELWDSQSPTAAAAGPLACRHRGSTTGETVVCPSCRGAVTLKLFACAIHGRCTQARAAAGIPCCATCVDRAPQPTSADPP